MNQLKPITGSGVTRVRSPRPELSKMTPELTCQYGNCGEDFDTHEERLEHSMREHTDLNPKKYPNMTGRDTGLKF